MGSFACAETVSSAAFKALSGPDIISIPRTTFRQLNMTGRTFEERHVQFILQSFDGARDGEGGRIRAAAVALKLLFSANAEKTGWPVVCPYAPLLRITQLISKFCS